MNDLQLRQNVIDELEFAPHVDAANIGVAAAKGVVTLSGHVTSYDQKLTVEETVRHVKGVKAIASELDVRYPWQKKTADDEIARRGVDILKWSETAPDGAIQLTVNQGWVTLAGCVDWQFQRQAVESQIRKLSGVLGVINKIEIRQRVQPADVREKIESALRRSAQVEADSIRITIVGDGTVLLEGQVHDWNEREAVEHAAWSAPGVVVVRDMLTVA